MELRTITSTQLACELFFIMNKSEKVTHLMIYVKIKTKLNSTSVTEKHKTHIRLFQSFCLGNMLLFTKLNNKYSMIRFHFNNIN